VCRHAERYRWRQRKRTVEQVVPQVQPKSCHPLPARSQTRGSEARSRTSIRRFVVKRAPRESASRFRTHGNSCASGCMRMLRSPRRERRRSPFSYRVPRCRTSPT
jgi:hypothetical protein